MGNSEAEKNRILFIGGVIAVIALGISLRIGNLEIKKRTPDERIYTHYAQAVLEGGIKNYKQVVRNYNNNENVWVYPPPVRIGYIFLGAAAMKLAGSNDTKILGYLSCIASILALFLLTLTGIKFFNRWVTLAALGLSSVSPMELAIARRAWQDSVLALFGLLLVYISCHITYKPRSKLLFIAFFILGSFCLLIKESGIIIYGVCLIWVLYITLIKERNLRKSLAVLFFSLLGIGVSVFIMAAVCAGIGNVIDAVKHNIGSLAGNSYALVYNSGPWFKIIQGFFLLTPPAAILCFIGIIGIIFSDKKKAAAANMERRVILGIVFFVISFTVIAMGPQNLRNLRYYSSIYMLFYLLAGLGSYYVAAFFKNILRPRLVLIGVIIGISVIAFLDYRRFQYLFIAKETPDLAVKLLMER